MAIKSINDLKKIEKQKRDKRKTLAEVERKLDDGKNKSLLEVE